MTLRALTEQKRRQDLEKVNLGNAMLHEANRLLKNGEHARKSVQDTNRAIRILFRARQTNKLCIMDILDAPSINQFLKQK